MTITIATKNQLNIVSKLAHAIWPHAYGAILSQDQLDYMLNMIYSIEALENQMLNKNQVFLLIAQNEKYLGFCAYELQAENSNNTKLHKLYVLPETQGKGVGKLLLNKVEQIAQEHNNKTVFLNVNRYNKAKAFYKSQGYSIIKTIDIEIGHGYLMEDYIMEKALK